mgnify:CR=1 FL=1
MGEAFTAVAENTEPTAREFKIGTTYATAAANALAAILANAAAIIVAHNHPSGDPTPSAEDRAITQRLKQAGELLGIHLLDHVILGHSGYHSFVDAGEL